MVLIEVLLEMVTDVGAPLFVNVAMSSGTVFAVGVEVQLPPVVHSPPGPVQVPLTWACARSGQNAPSAPSHTPPSSAARVSDGRAAGAAIRTAKSPIEASAARRPACAARGCNRYERITNPCNDTAGKTRPCATLPAAPATDVSQTLRGESRPINSGWGALR